MGCGGSRATPSTGRSTVERSEYLGRHAGLHNTNTEIIESTVASTVRAADETDLETIKVKGVDLNVTANTKQHHTDEFEITEETQTVRKLVIRRGQTFEITIEFNRAYDSAKDDLRLSFAYGPSPKITRGTLVEFILSEKDDPTTWGALIQEKNGNSVRLTIMTPAHCQVGKWNLMIDAVKRTDAETIVYRHKLPDPIYILFNPWCKGDEVYLNDDALLKEYILTPYGKIYSGSYKYISYKPWNFAQFSGNVLDCAIYLIEQSHLPDFAKGDPIVVCRKISALVNAPDDDGVLIGNWSGDYTGGTPPLAWGGSEAILEQYYKTKQPVKYGQCWVFSAIVTTVCRALGIPTRSVTNFASAHDTDASVTIDSYFDSEGNKIDAYETDSVWNFHVWNDVWMARPDLPQGYGGWQAIDATPQETSNGVFCMGPMSLLAIRRGETRLPYDGAFVFAEVNADRVAWTRNEKGEWEKSGQSKFSVGKNISTKLPNSREIEDVTDQYKCKEGSAENLAAVRRAISYASHFIPVYEPITPDVDFKILPKDNVFMGEDVTVTLKMTNKSNETRTINGRLNFHSMYYTGVLFKNVKSLKMSDSVIEAGKDLEIKLEIPVSEYIDKLADHCNCLVTSMCLVKETKQSNASEDNVRLRKPHLELKAPDTGKVGEAIKVDVSFVNPLPVPLTKCELRVEGAGLQKPAIYKKDNVPAKETYTGSFEITPRRVGEREITAYFNSFELSAITGEHTVTVN